MHAAGGRYPITSGTRHQQPRGPSFFFARVLFFPLFPPYPRRGYAKGDQGLSRKGPYCYGLQSLSSPFLFYLRTLSLSFAISACAGFMCAVPFCLYFLFPHADSSRNTCSVRKMPLVMIPINRAAHAHRRTNRSRFASQHNDVTLIQYKNSSASESNPHFFSVAAFYVF